MNRREIIAALAAGGSVPIAALAGESNNDDETFAGPTMRLITILDEPVKCMTVFQDTVVIATEHGKVYQLRSEDF